MALWGLWLTALSNHSILGSAALPTHHSTISPTEAGEEEGIEADRRGRGGGRRGMKGESGCLEYSVRTLPVQPLGCLGSPLSKLFSTREVAHDQGLGTHLCTVTAGQYLMVAASG